MCVIDWQFPAWPVSITIGLCVQRNQIRNMLYIVVFSLFLNVHHFVNGDDGIKDDFRVDWVPFFLILTAKRKPYGDNNETVTPYLLSRTVHQPSDHWVWKSDGNKSINILNSSMLNSSRIASQTNSKRKWTFITSFFIYNQFICLKRRRGTFCFSRQLGHKYNQQVYVRLFGSFLRRKGIHI